MEHSDLNPAKGPNLYGSVKRCYTFNTQKEATVARFNAQSIVILVNLLSFKKPPPPYIILQSLFPLITACPNPLNGPCPFQALYLGVA